MAEMPLDRGKTIKIGRRRVDGGTWTKIHSRESRGGGACACRQANFFPTTCYQCTPSSYFEPQGLVTYTDSSAESGGLCVVPGSHKHHDDLCSRSPSASMLKDFVHVQEDDTLLRDGGGLRDVDILTYLVAF